ncbi:hypothetical protein [Paraburkholderia sediminicola]|uniref:hypothetical protein n=1 Tax=Paraburkholderia sediminicola TaxID=458836 RepID=UPI0038B98455
METRSRKTGKALKPTDFRLIDFRIKKLTAERFSDGEGEDTDGDGGATRTRTSAESSLPDKEAPSTIAGIDLTVTLEGFQGEGRGDEDRSFSITMNADFLFMSKNEGWVRIEDAPEFVHSSVMQAFPLVVAKLRQIAHEMGFTGVDPDIGLSPSTRPVPADPKTSSGTRRKLPTT